MLRLSATAACTAGILCLPWAASSDDGPQAGAGSCSSSKFCVGVGGETSSGGKQGTSHGGGEGDAGKGGKKSKVQCHLTKMPKDQTPPANHPIWKQAHASPRDKGSLYFKACDDENGDVAGADGFVFRRDGEEQPQVDPETLAYRALDEMDLQQPKITMSPKPGGTGLVGMPVWLSVDKASKQRYGPNNASASAGGTTVTAEAKVARVVWRLGDGSTKTCTGGEMKSYKKSYGMKDSACGHRYRSLPEGAVNGRGKYRVSATAYWDVEWHVDGGGESGDLDTSRSSSVQVPIVESQAVN